MCGIAGVVATDPGRARALVERMLPTIAHRGPDDSGVLERGPMALGHRRLSVVDLSPAGHQPMMGPGGDVAISYNGELYGWQETRRRMEVGGRPFVSNTDTEVLLALFERHGVDAFPQVNGMFAAAFHDRRSQRLTLVRDRLGIKPLFWFAGDGLFVFGSEIKAVLAAIGRTPPLRSDALAQYLLAGYISSPATVYRGIHQLPAGHLLTVDLNRWPDPNAVSAAEPWWDAPFTAHDERPDREIVDELDALVHDAVAIRRVADVPLGALLSGGVDSGLVTASLARSAGTAIETFTITTPGHERDETDRARAVARHVGSHHHELPATADLLATYWAAADHFDQPFNCVSLANAHVVSELARSRVTVALSGDGGDELFAGYGWYDAVASGRGAPSALAPWARRLPPDRRGVPGLQARLDGPFERAFTSRHPVSVGEAQTLMGTDLAPWVSMHRDLWERWPADPVTRATYLDVKTYLTDHILAKVDRASMAHALEVRVPLLDYRIVELAGSLPLPMKRRGGTTKWALKQVAARYLPSGHVDLPKIGFDPPLAEWAFDRHLPQRLGELAEPDAPVRQYVDGQLLDRWIATTRHPERSHVPRRSALWALYQLDRWLRARG